MRSLDAILHRKPIQLIVQTQT